MFSCRKEFFSTSTGNSDRLCIIWVIERELCQAQAIPAHKAGVALFFGGVDAAGHDRQLRFIYL